MYNSQISPAICNFLLTYRKILWYAEFVGVVEKPPIFICEVFSMVREIVHDPILLGRKSIPATREDLQIAQDLLDTLTANAAGCVGMAANMIGQHKRIIVFDNEGSYMTMFNPQIVRQSEPYETEEGCLSLLGGPRKTTRYRKIKVQYQTADFQTRLKTFSGWTAQIIQHEIDHCNGILI